MTKSNKMIHLTAVWYTIIILRQQTCGCGWVGLDDLPDTDKRVGLSREEAVAVGTPGERDANGSGG